MGPEGIEQLQAGRIGLISDTHGLLRPDVFAVFEGVDLILHAGDVGPDAILDELGVIAPVKAVRGNTDAPGNPRLPESIELEINGLRVHVSHGHEVGASPDRLLATYDADVIVYGHSHRELVTRGIGRLVVNPGAAGPRRFDLKPCVALLTIAKGEADVELVRLGD
jgi:putative phosphoesterase